MNLFAKLNNPKWRESPLVWIRRLVIMDGISEKPVRDVSLQPGLNIIWGKESKGTEKQAFQPGHGLGKTTFCRLIRFCLGESSFGQSRTVAGVQNDFPDGYVEAVIEVSGETWCVRRHFSSGHSSFARRATSLSTFVRRPPASESDSYSTFSTTIAAASLNSLDEKQFLADQKPFRWEHLLAMCSRDQEARYVDPLQWRSKRSTAEMPAFSQPKADAIRCVLAILGIYTDKDCELAAREQEIKKRVSLLERRKSKGRDRLDYWEDHYREQLANAGVDDALERSLESGGLFPMEPEYRRVHDTIVAEIADLDQKITELEIQITYAGASLKEKQEHRLLKEGSAEAFRTPAEEAIADLDKYRTELADTLQRLNEIKFSLCEYGNTSFGKCVHVQEYQQQLKDSLTALPKVVPDEVEQKIELAKKIEATTAKLREAEGRVESELQTLVKKK